MKKLFVVRHAKSSWDYPELDDYDRPLNKRGKRSAPEMGQRLAKRNIVPDLMITSPAKRAAATARRIAEEIDYPKSKIEKESVMYHGSVQNIIKALQRVSNDVATLMVFGHNPVLTDLVNHLSGADIYNIPTCGIAEIDFATDSWAAIDRNEGTLISFDFPKNVPADSQ